MKIVVSGSMSFIQEMVKISEALKSLGHVGFLPPNTEKYLAATEKIEKREEKIKLDIFKFYFEEIKNSDALLVVNEKKGDIENYIGANVLIEMSFAYVLSKKIYLWNPIPNMSYSEEIEAMKPIILNQNISKIV